MNPNDLISLAEEIKLLRSEYSNLRGRAVKKERRNKKIIINSKIKKFNEMVKFKAFHNIQ